VDLDIGTAISINSSALKVACGPPGIGGKEVQESPADHHSPTYPASAVTLEGAGVDLDICAVGEKCSTLRVPCPPPGHGRAFFGHENRSKIKQGVGLTYADGFPFLIVVLRTSSDDPLPDP
jgi:hypothetical protein